MCYMGQSGYMDSEHFPALPMVLPLPKEEGQGKGKGRFLLNGYR